MSLIGSRPCTCYGITVVDRSFVSLCNLEMKIKTIGLATLLSFAAGAMCFAAPNPTEGTWKLDEGKSKLGEGMGKTLTVVWEKAGEEEKCTVDGVDADGKKTHTVWTGKLDGKDYAITGDATSDMRSFKL